jgi:hypothetical protein
MKNPTWLGARSGWTAFATHGRLGARVALLQSPTLPNANVTKRRTIQET